MAPDPRFRVEYHGGSIQLPRGRTHVGRGVACRIRFNDESISRQHILLTVSLEAVVLRDLDSTNGTRVNGVHLVGPRALVDGDIVELGNTWFRLRSEDPVVSSDDVDTSPTVQPELVHAASGVVNAQLLDKLDTDEVSKACPRCGAALAASAAACRCGFAWPRGRATANTQRIDLKRVERGAERRAHVRVPQAMPVIYDSSSLTFEAMARDVSMGGMFIECELLDDAGTECTVTVLPDGAPALPLRAAVAHVRVQAEPGKPSGMGVQFSTIEDSARMWLESLLMVPPSTPVFE